MDKKEYETPKIEIRLIPFEDIVTSSRLTQYDPTDEYEGDILKYGYMKP